MAEQVNLLAHCASLTVNGLRNPVSNSREQEALRLSAVIGLDMTGYWQATSASYFGRVSKERILEAVREASGDDAVRRIAGMKKQAMASAAEEMLAEKGWFPPLLRTPAAA